MQAGGYGKTAHWLWSTIPLPPRSCKQPLKMGADLVLHSATKFLGSHADALGSVVCGRSDLIQQICHYREINGATLDPMAAYLLLRGMKTLQLRVERQSQSALNVARYLAAHPAVDEVFYPCLESHPQHEILNTKCQPLAACSVLW